MNAIHLMAFSQHLDTKLRSAREHESRDKTTRAVGTARPSPQSMLFGSPQQPSFNIRSTCSAATRHRFTAPSDSHLWSPPHGGGGLRNLLSVRLCSGSVCRSSGSGQDSLYTSWLAPFPPSRDLYALLEAELEDAEAHATLDGHCYVDGRRQLHIALEGAKRARHRVGAVHRRVRGLEVRDVAHERDRRAVGGPARDSED